MKTSILILIISVLIYVFIEHINRRTHKLLDETEKRIRQLIDETLLKLNNQTTEQMDSVLEKSRKHIPLQNPYGATTCTEWFGCHKGYCWAGCAAAFPSVTGPEWCYTTKSNRKVSCSDDKDCNGCWRCSTTCSI